MHVAGQQMDREQAQRIDAAVRRPRLHRRSKRRQGEEAESAEIEAKYNVARTYLWKNRPDQAQPLLEEIVRRRPWEDRFLTQLAACYYQSGYLAQAERVLFAIADGAEPDTAGMTLLWARIKLARGDLGGALQALLAAEAMNPQLPGIYIQIGDTYARLLQWQNAKIAYEKAIALDEDNALAFQGLSTVYRRLGDNQQTVDCALRAVSLLHRLPLAHFNLGVALARSGETRARELAFETALRFQPEMINAHRYLATIHKSEGGNREKAEFHRSEVFRLTRSRGRRSAGADSKREKLFDLPEIPKREERLAILLKERPDPKPRGRNKVRQDVRPCLRPAALGHIAHDAVARGRRHAADDRWRTRCGCRQPARLLRMGSDQADREKTGVAR